MAQAPSPLFPYDVAGVTVLFPDVKYNQVIVCPRCLQKFGPPLHDAKLQLEIDALSPHASPGSKRGKRSARGHNQYYRHLKQRRCEVDVAAGGCDVSHATLAFGINAFFDDGGNLKSRSGRLNTSRSVENTVERPEQFAIDPFMTIVCSGHRMHAGVPLYQPAPQDVLAYIYEAMSHITVPESKSSGIFAMTSSESDTS